jgi:hypothetical protein
MDADVEKMIDWLDTPVFTNNLINAYNTLLRYSNANKGQKFLDAYYDAGLAKNKVKK